MNDYISKNEPIEEIKRIYCTSCNSYNGAMCRACEHQDDIDIIEDTKAADVQPVNQWISVKERQPDKDDLYLVAVENEICVYIDIADYSNNQWHKHDEVIYWQPLPELPKEG